MRASEQKKRRIFQNVDVIDTADEGLAIGRCPDGLIIQVKGAVPGDQVDAVVIEKRKGMFITKVLISTNLRLTVPIHSALNLVLAEDVNGSTWSIRPH